VIVVLADGAAVLDDALEHRPALLAQLDELDAHAVRLVGPVAVVLADPPHLARALDHRRLVGQPDLEPELGAGRLGVAARQEHAAPADVDGELRDELIDRVIAQTDAQRDGHAYRCALVLVVHPGSPAELSLSTPVATSIPPGRMAVKSAP
jgi:hypothetical protein